MSTTSVSSFPADWTAADMQEHLGGIPLDRILMVPPPGTATEEDVLAVHARTGRLCELVDGTWVEKVMEYRESRFAVVLGHFLETYLDARPLGSVAGADGMLRLFPGMARIPDLSFILWERFPDRRLPRQPIPPIPPISPWKCFPRAIRSRRCNGNFASTSSQARGWCGTSTRNGAPRGSTRPWVNGPTSTKTAFCRAATCFPASSCGWATFSTGPKAAADDQGAIPGTRTDRARLGNTDDYLSYHYWFVSPEYRASSTRTRSPICGAST